MLTRFKHEKLPRFVAHRGAWSYRTENTKEAFDVAYDFKPKFEAIGSSMSLEFDVRLTKDNVPLLIHDYDTLRVVGEKHLVAETTYADMQKLDFTMQYPEHTATLITLPEMFDRYPDVIFDLELKDKGERGKRLADVTLDIIKQYDCPEKIIMHIHDIETAEYAIGKYPKECFFETPPPIAWKFAEDVLDGKTPYYHQSYQQLCLPLMQKSKTDKNIVHQYTEQRFADMGRQLGYPILTYWEWKDQGDHTADIVQAAIDAGADSLILDDIELVLEVFTKHAQSA